MLVIKLCGHHVRQASALLGLTDETRILVGSAEVENLGLCPALQFPLSIALIWSESLGTRLPFVHLWNEVR